MNICCGYSLEVPHIGTSYEYPQCMFSLRNKKHTDTFWMFVCGEVLRSSQPNGVMSSAVSLPSHTFTGQA